MKMTLAARVMANKVNVRFPGRVERRVEFGSGSTDEIATAIAAARGNLLVALRLGKVSSWRGQRAAEPSVTIAASISSSTVECELLWLSQSQKFTSLYFA
jgi:hypothetical protein